MVNMFVGQYDAIRLVTQWLLKPTIQRISLQMKSTNSVRQNYAGSRPGFSSINLTATHWHTRQWKAWLFALLYSHNPIALVWVERGSLCPGFLFRVLWATTVKHVLILFLRWSRGIARLFMGVAVVPQPACQWLVSSREHCHLAWRSKADRDTWQIANATW